MPDFSTETKTYIGQTGTHAFDGYAGLRIGRQYQLQVRREGGQVFIVLPHAHTGPGREMELSAAQYERWFVK